mmetsp:Transcript_72126/g.211714  ORF Transcript_72126/g.211714 Transcript_72126/m.211714 type:complete len:229 (-) Transcript_72126:193-879(-)
MRVMRGGADGLGGPSRPQGLVGGLRQECLVHVVGRELRLRHPRQLLEGPHLALQGRGPGGGAAGLLQRVAQVPQCRRGLAPDEALELADEAQLLRALVPHVRAHRLQDPRLQLVRLLVDLEALHPRGLGLRADASHDHLGLHPHVVLRQDVGPQAVGAPSIGVESILLHLPRHLLPDLHQSDGAQERGYGLLFFLAPLGGARARRGGGSPGLQRRQELLLGRPHGQRH